MADHQPSPPPLAPATTEYENNPFFVAANGITLLFNKAKSVAITLIILSVLGSLANGISNIYDNSSTSRAENIDWSTVTAQQVIFVLLIVGFLLIVSLVVSIMVSGIMSYTAAQSAKGKSVGIKEAFNEVLGRFGSYGWVYILRGLKLFGWYLLFIVPGVYFTVRYSLAGVAFFDDSKDLKGNAAIKESTRLTKDAWLTTYASTTLFNWVTLGLIGSLITTGTSAILYKQFDLVDKSGAAKPQPHALSWATLVLTFALIALLIAIFVVIAVLAASNFS